MTTCQDCGSALVERNVLALPNPDPEARATFVRTALVTTCPRCDAPGETLQIDVVVMSVHGMLEQTLDPTLTVAEVLQLYRSEYPAALTALLPHVDNTDGKRVPVPIAIPIGRLTNDGALVLYLALVS